MERIHLREIICVALATRVVRGAGEGRRRELKHALGVGGFAVGLRQGTNPPGGDGWG